MTSTLTITSHTGYKCVFHNHSCTNHGHEERKQLLLSCRQVHCWDAVHCVHSLPVYRASGCTKVIDCTRHPKHNYILSCTYNYIHAYIQFPSLENPPRNPFWSETAFESLHMSVPQHQHIRSFNTEWSSVSECHLPKFCKHPSVLYACVCIEPP